MEDVQKYADLVFTKERFLSSVRTIAEGMIKSLPAKVQEEIAEEVGDRGPELMVQN